MRKERLRSLVGFVLASILAIVAFGCGGGGTEATTGGGSASRGTMNIYLADAPDPTVTAVNLTITRVEANVDGQWVNIPVQTGSLNLLDLTKNDVLLATGQVPTGQYGQVRVFIGGATVTDADGTHQVTIPSAAQSGVKLNLNAPVDANNITSILLDFNLDKSLHKTGNGRYMLQPVIPAVLKVHSGTVTGTVRFDDNRVAGWTSVRAIYTAGSNYALGTEVNTTFTVADGTFKLWALLPGTYRLEFSVADGDVVRTAIVNDVVVTANSNTDVGVVVVR